MNSIELSLVMPVKDEEVAIGPCLARLIPVIEAMNDPAARSFEILFVDDGSTDSTLDVIRKANAADPRVRGISLSRNFGKEAALTAGLDAARGIGGRAARCRPAGSARSAAQDDSGVAQRI